MNSTIVDIIFTVVTMSLIGIIQILDPKLPETLLVKGQDNQIVFSLAKKKLRWLIVSLGFYVWLMEFIIVKDLLLLRLVTPLLLELSLFCLLVVTNLGYRKLGERLAIAGLISFVISVVYLVL
ncbi:MAG: hypothetical protein R6V17_07790 [Halanaerobacter sp.]